MPDRPTCPLSGNDLELPPWCTCKTEAEQKRCQWYCLYYESFEGEIEGDEEAGPT